MYYIISKVIIIFILVHVDDYLLASNSKEYVKNFINAFNKKYGVNELGRLSQNLQITVEISDKIISLSQTRDIEELATKYSVTNTKPKHTPMEANFNLPKNDIEDRRFPYRQLQGSLLWIARATRPDIS
jgi:hypothetical protein